MIQSVVAVLGLAVMIEMSRRADRRFRGEQRLPMQWLLDGTVIWTAPRRVALAFTPVLAAFVLAATVAMTLLLKPRPGQEGLEVPVVAGMALVFIGAHALHLWLIVRFARK